MKTVYVLFGTLLGLCLLITDSLAQRANWTKYESTTTLRLGMQSVGLAELNQALQQAGYTPLASQIPFIGCASQFSRTDRPFSLHTEFGASMGSGFRTTNGTYKVRAGIMYLKLGGSYRLINSERFQLAPQLSLLSLPFSLFVSPVNNTMPSLNAALTNPGSAQTVSLATSTAGIEAGLTANLRIPYSQIQTDCAITERAFVLGLDAGYRFASRTPLDASHEISTSNPAIQLSGWYAGLRVGFSIRGQSKASSATYSN